jgi:hypothetical protein
VKVFGKAAKKAYDELKAEQSQSDTAAEQK